ncbi:MAG: glycosyltransferase family 4 protein [Cyanobacteria bacterium P01_F01_bin.150]
MANSKWICCQIGAREHYEIPRSLRNAGRLETLITDAWVSPDSAIRDFSSKIVPSLSERYHPDLQDANVQAFTGALISFELQQKLSRSTGWSNILARNQWFQYQALSHLKFLSRSFSRPHTLDNKQPNPTLFSYSYAALELFKFAKQQGWRTVLGQTDPGIIEQQIMERLQSQDGQQYRSNWVPAPSSYWKRWRQECDLADQIIVNSAWSQTALVKAGITAEKIAITPLAYQPPAAMDGFERTYPSRFSRDRPLRVLFLGKIILRKGIAALLEALPHIDAAPIEIWLVGPTELTLPPALASHSQLKWLGPVPRNQVQQHYRNADVFLFPTHSDGFGLTQLEAQAWQLPIIASEQCGKVVGHQQNGLILPGVSGEAIAEALLTCCRSPQTLQQWANHSVDSRIMRSYSLHQLAQTLNNVCQQVIAS